MKYAIDTLVIELAKCLEAKRVIEKYSVYPEYIGDPEIDWQDRIDKLSNAIHILESSGAPKEEE